MNIGITGGGDYPERPTGQQTQAYLAACVARFSLAHVPRGFGVAP